MYLSDKELQEKWAELNIQCDNADCQVNCSDHIQPSSIDFCLSNVFWEPKKRNPVDLRKSALLELAPRRYWKRRVLRKDEYVRIPAKSATHSGDFGPPRDVTLSGVTMSR